MARGRHGEDMSTRYLETAELMGEALLELLNEKDLAYVTVKEICRRAGVSRSTFYLHYEGIADLLAESSQLLIGRLAAKFDGSPEKGRLVDRLKTCPESELCLIVPTYLTPYLEFVRDNRRLFSAIVEHPEAFRLHSTYEQMEERVFSPIFDRLLTPQEARPYIMTFYLHGLMAIVARWVGGGCSEPVPYIADLMEQCCTR